MYVKAAARTLQILEVFATERRPLALSELSRLLSMPPSSCLALIKTCQTAGYLYEVDRRRGYYPTRRSLDVGTSTLRGDPVLQKLGRPLRRLRDQCGEMVVVGALEANRVVCLHVFEAPQQTSYAVYAGDFGPLHASAIGKALLSALSMSERDALLRDYKFARLTPLTLASRPALERDLLIGGKRGWYTNLSESRSDVAGVACPLRAPCQRYAIAIGGPIQRVGTRVAELGPHLTAVENAIMAASRP